MLPFEDDNYEYTNYLDYFRGREDFFACQGPNYYYPINRPLSEYYLQKHFAGSATFGVYVLTSESSCYFICIDIDIPKDELNSVSIDRKEKFSHLGNKLSVVHKLLVNEFGLPQETILFEDTGGRGFHIWLFFCNPLSGKVAVSLHAIMKRLLDFDFEFFPKQGKLDHNRKFGNLIKLPLGVHQKYSNKSAFFRLVDDRTEFFNSHVENIRHLNRIKKLSTGVIEEIIKKHSSQKEIADSMKNVDPEEFRPESRRLYVQDFNSLFERCKALMNLKTKCENHIQLSKTETFHLSNLLLSIQNGHTLLLELIEASYGSRFRRDITQREMDNIQPLYPSSCATLIRLGICEGYCNVPIQKRNTDPLLSNTTPISFWLIPMRRQRSFKEDQILKQITNPDSVTRAYWQLRKYHEYEDVGFFDEFDYDFFEENLEAYSKYIARAFKHRENIPLIGYLDIDIPKKLDENNKMQYRPMVYSSIFDQVIIQTIFGTIGPSIEAEFDESSYGYRLNIDDPESEHIFNDWREYYPKFRSRALSILRSPNIHYYICCDIQGFYDHVVHRTLMEQLKGIIHDQYILQTVEEFIKLYSFEKNGVNGLPQGPAYARVLANLYLNDFDKQMAQISSDYLRYVDDLFFFFGDQENAEASLQIIVKALHELGLNLSNDESKKPQILDANSEDRIIATLDNLRYGAFEELKFVEHLDDRKVNELYDAIERQHFSIADTDELLAINADLPTLLYQTAKNRKYHSIKDKVLKIIEYLVNYRGFYPKRLKYVAYRLISLMREANKDFNTLYSNLEDVHKIYFLLALYKESGECDYCRNAVNRAVEQGLTSSDCFVQGLSIAIWYRMNSGDVGRIVNTSSFKNLLDTQNYFVITKLLYPINYFDLNTPQKEIVRRRILPGSSFIEKKYLLRYSFPTGLELTDILFISNLLKHDTHLLFSECSLMMAKIRDDNSLFTKLTSFLLDLENYKDIILYHLTSLVFTEYKDAHRAQLDNQVQLYSKINDKEMRRELTNVVNRILSLCRAQDGGIVCRDLLIENYNTCSYLKNLTDGNKPYDFVEYIPMIKLNEYGFGDWSQLKNKVAGLAHSHILPNLVFEIDTMETMVIIKYSIPASIKPLNEKDFKKTMVDLKYVLELMEELYKKTRFFYIKFGLLPPLLSDNLLLDADGHSLLLRKLGSILSPIHFISGERIKNGEGAEAEIPRMLSLLLKELIFKNQHKEIDEFLKASTPKSGVTLFVAHFIERMSSTKPENRYSYDRFNFLVDGLKRLDENNDYDVSSFYFQERLKARLYENNRDTVNWAHICKSLEDFLRELAVTYELIDFGNISFTNKTFLNFSLPRNLHYLSRILLNLSLNKENLFKNRLATDAVNVLDLLNYFAVFCIEIVSFFKVGLAFDRAKRPPPRMAAPFTVFGSQYSQDYDSGDIESINRLVEADKNHHNIFDFTMQFSLKQFSLFYLFKAFPFEIDKNDKIFIRKCNDIRESVFRQTAFVMLRRVPDIESQMISLVHSTKTALRTNTNYEVSDNMFKIKDEIIALCKDVGNLRKRMGCKRFYGRQTKINKFPPELHVRSSFFFSCYETGQTSLDKNPLVKRYPSSRSKCSWDVVNNEITNLVIPSEQVTKLISKLKGGRFEVIRYIYSDKAKLLWDLGFFIALLVVAVFFYNLARGSETANKLHTWTSMFGIYNALAVICGTFATWRLCKAITDLKYWSKKISQVITYFKADR